MEIKLISQKSNIGEYVVTLVFFHGNEPYLGCKTHHEMLEWNQENHKYKKYIWSRLRHCRRLVIYENNTLRRPTFRF